MPRSCVYQFRHARVEQKYRPAWASNNCAPPQPSPPIASPHRRTTYASVRMMMAVAAGALFMSAIAGPASAQNVKWQNIVGIVQAGNIVGSFTTPPSCPVPPATPVGVGCINGGGQPWTTLGGQAKVNLSNSKLEFEVNGLVLAGGNSIGTPDTITSVQGTLICIVGTATSNVILNTTSVPLSRRVGGSPTDRSEVQAITDLRTSARTGPARVGPLAGLHAVATPPSSVRNWRRLRSSMGSPSEPAGPAYRGLGCPGSARRSLT
jgi:hypothetical protein